MDETQAHGPTTTPNGPDRVDDLTDTQIETALLHDGTAEDPQHAEELRGDYRTLRQILLTETATRTPISGLLMHTTEISRFTAAVEVKGVGGTHPIDAAVAFLSTVGGDWYVLHGTGMKGYVVAQQGHAGGDGFGRTRKRPITWWATDPALSRFAAWNVAVEFITAQVHADLKDEWGEQ